MFDFINANPVWSIVALILICFLVNSGICDICNTVIRILNKK